MRYSTTARLRRAGRLRLILCLGLLLTALAACKDDPRDEDPPDPEPPNNGLITGTFVTQDLNAAISDDPADNRGATITVIDETHVPVQRLNLTDPSFSLMTELLEPPYFLELNDQPSGITVRSVATGPGTINITPLTDIVSALLLARSQPDGFIEPDDYYYMFGLFPRPRPGTVPNNPPPEPGPSDPSRINDTAIQRAEMQTRSALESLGVDVDPAIEDFITQPFEYAEGDPMYDTIVDFVNTLRNRNLTLGEYKDQLLANDRICATVDKITVMIDGGAQLFCPSERTGTADDDGTTYRFSTVDGDALSVTAAGGMVSAATLEIGAGTFTCEVSACAGIGITDNVDQPGSRDVRFDGAMLADGMSNATLDGTLTAPPPGFPPLAMGCAGKPPFFFSTTGGVRASGCLRAVNAVTGNQFEGPRLFKIEDLTYGGYEVTVALDNGDQVVFVSVVPSFDNENPPGDYIAFKCRRDEPAASCSGVSLTESDANDVRNIRFDDVDLLGVDADGSLSPDAQATLNGVIPTDQAEPLPVMSEPNSSNNALNGRVSPDCDALGVRDVLNADVTDGDWQLCVPDAYGSSGFSTPRRVRRGEDVVVYDFSTAFDFMSENPVDDRDFARSDFFSVLVDRNTRDVQRATFSRNTFSNERYTCGWAMPCSGISVSVPDDQGIVSITMDNAMLSEVQVFPSLTARGLPNPSAPESRSAVLSGSLSTRPCPDDSAPNCILVGELTDGEQADLADDE